MMKPEPDPLQKPLTLPAHLFVVSAIVISLLLTIIGLLLYQNSLLKKQIQTPVSSPTIVSTPTPVVVDPTANWDTYVYRDIRFKYPSQWDFEYRGVIGGSRFTQDFIDPDKKYDFSFVSFANYNQITSKPFSTIDEFINMPYQVKPVTIDGQDGRQPLPRAGSENVNTVYFFSKDKQSIYSLSLKTGDTSQNTPVADVLTGQKLFDQILSTFKFD